MQQLKRALVWALAVAALGMAAAAALAPGLISWWYAPPVGGGMDCGPAISWALGQLVRAEVIVAGGGGLLSLVVSLVASRRAARK